MQKFLMFHAIYLSGGLSAYLIQFLVYTRILKRDWKKEPAFKAAMISFCSWMYVLAFGYISLFNKKRVALKTILILK